MKTLATVLLLAAAPAAAKNSSLAERDAGLKARMEGRDDDALKHFRLGSKVEPQSDAAGDCRIYAEWLTTDKAKSPGSAKGLEEYRAGVKAFRRGDLASADASWHRCIDAEEGITQVKRDCMAMLDLIPKKTTASPARQSLIRGMAAYTAGKPAEARAAWERCLETGGEDEATLADCRRMLAKLDSEGKKP